MMPLKCTFLNENLRNLQSWKAETEPEPEEIQLNQDFPGDMKISVKYISIESDLLVYIDGQASAMVNSSQLMHCVVYF